MNQHETTGRAQTVLALFDDAIDAELALEAMRKASRPGAIVSVLARDRRLHADAPEGRLDVADAVSDTALSAVSGWLPGLAALDVPDHGCFLVGGPIGVALVQRERQVGADAGGGGAAISAAPASGLGATLERFGFRPEEAHYFEERLVAGSTLIAVTADERPHIDATLGAFAAHGAVYIGQAETAPEVIRQVELQLAAPFEPAAADVTVTDIVAPLERTCGQSGSADQEWCHRPVIDGEGASAGAVDDLLIERTGGDGAGTIRYVVVGFGGVLGIGRRRVAIPAAVATLSDGAVRLGVTVFALSDAPGYSQDAPFSRSDELAVHAYFGMTPYWLA